MGKPMTVSISPIDTANQINASHQPIKMTQIIHSQVGAMMNIFNSIEKVPFGVQNSETACRITAAARLELRGFIENPPALVSLSKRAEYWAHSQHDRQFGDRTFEPLGYP